MLKIFRIEVKVSIIPPKMRAPGLYSHIISTIVKAVATTFKI